MTFLGQVIQWFTNPAHWHGANGIPTRLEEHVVMSLAAIVAATVIALPIGIVLGHTGRGGLLAINVSNLGRAIPSFALLVVLLLVLGLGAAPAFIALVALAVPPMVTNAYAGMRGVDRGLIDAARG
ncbi:MAG: ABC transporter permease subunit, partial [bacterium]|nr:ABC transporter permease subunit [bacterium]